ncbi:MAG: hypothetical protein JXB49_04330 [Bacteroidales bacterium]|nr:hypothetical protein [Bacteroidales bacterium]
MLGIIFGILGIILTIFFGIIALKLSKKGKIITQLRFEKSECYQLFKTAINRLNIEIKYNNKSIGDKLILLKAKIINSGTRDIDKKSIYEPISILTNDNYKWLEANIVDQPVNIVSKSLILDENKLQIEWDLLKKNEYIEIEALIDTINDEKEYEKANDFYNSLDFSFRITDLDKIEKEKFLSAYEERTLTRLQYLLMMAILYIVFGFYLIIEGGAIERIIPNIPKSNNVLEFTIRTPDGDTIYSKIESINTDRIQLNNSNKEKISIAKNLFNKDYQILGVHKINENKILSIFKTIGGTVIIILGLLLFIIIKIIKSGSKKEITFANTV